jgi:hypothetical protein
MEKIIKNFFPKPASVNQTQGTRPPHQMRERGTDDGKAPRPPREVRTTRLSCFLS